MRNNKSVLFIILLLFILTVASYAEYDSNKVKSVMRDNVQLMGKIGKAAQSEDFQYAGESLMKLAQGMISIQKYTPLRGTQSEWDSTMDAFISAAFKGIGASGDKDIDALVAAINELKSLNSQGHRDHK